ncbi:MAG: hypothetical protein HPY66_2038 [Firmicutes bacterium]|nr:hypothetical protein [Bacillota bacterium]
MAEKGGPPQYSKSQGNYEVIAFGETVVQNSIGIMGIMN